MATTLVAASASLAKDAVSAAATIVLMDMGTPSPTLLAKRGRDTEVNVAELEAEAEKLQKQSAEEQKDTDEADVVFEDAHEQPNDEQLLESTQVVRAAEPSRQQEIEPEGADARQKKRAEEDILGGDAGAGKERSGGD